jgi:hypothetical protein
MTNILADHIHPSIRAGFVALPSDPNIPLTAEQLEAIFPHPEAWRDVTRDMTIHKLREVAMSESA